jgi:hypothetical protein
MTVLLQGSLTMCCAVTAMRKASGICRAAQADAPYALNHWVLRTEPALYKHASYPHPVHLSAPFPKHRRVPGLWAGTAPSGCL